MSYRESTGEVAPCIAPFMIGLLIGGVVASYIACIHLGRYLIVLADSPASQFDALLAGLILGMPCLLVFGLAWIGTALTLLCIVSRRPLAARSPYITFPLGCIAASSLVASFAAANGSFGYSGLCVAGVAPLLISPFLMVCRAAQNGR